MREPNVAENEQEQSLTAVKGGCEAFPPCPTTANPRIRTTIRLQGKEIPYALKQVPLRLL
jgi:hypothetical protein